MTRYISTRGPGTPQSFADVLMQGMAPDGGLYIPEKWPAQAMPAAGAAYADIAFGMLRHFTGGAPDDAALKKMISESYAGGVFDDAAVAPLREIGNNLWLMELWHGPTLSFKDYALQLVGRLFDHVLAQQQRRITIVGATSGDTGSAAIAACKDCRNIDIFILHPAGRVSDVQRKQMTTVKSPNVHNIAVNGTFDDCQALVKAAFADRVLADELNLSAVNSINWARIAAQTVYYAAAMAQLGRPASFAVPTGNFGNVYAGWTARRMGLPVGRLVVASNRNDILTRFFESGEMKQDTTVPSLSPSMDIQVSSNFERYLCELLGRDHAKTKAAMEEFSRNGKFSVAPQLLERARQEFHAVRCDDEQTLATMREFHRDHGLLVDPHTAVALHAAKAEQGRAGESPMVVLSTAHPAKFPDAVEKATGARPPAPESLARLMTLPEFCQPMPNDLKSLKNFLHKQVRAS
jgi:threonine synthase